MISENAVASDRVTIAAPAELVWQVIVDFGSYGEWNTFCPSIEGKLALGEPLTMQVDLGNGLQEQVESITVLEPPRQIVWSMENKPDDPIHADRAQVVEPIDATSCSYITIDTFGGEMMAPMIEAMGAPVEKGFNQCAQDLKARAEALFAAQSSHE